LNTAPGYIDLDLVNMLTETDVGVEVNNMMDDLVIHSVDELP